MRIDLDRRRQQRRQVGARGALFDQASEHGQPGVAEVRRLVNAGREHLNGRGDRLVPPYPEVFAGNLVVDVLVRKTYEVDIWAAPEDAASPPPPRVGVLPVDPRLRQQQHDSTFTRWH